MPHTTRWQQRKRPVELVVVCCSIHNNNTHNISVKFQQYKSRLKRSRVRPKTIFSFFCKNPSVIRLVGHVLTVLLALLLLVLINAHKLKHKHRSWRRCSNLCNAFCSLSPNHRTHQHQQWGLPVISASVNVSTTIANVFTNFCVQQRHKAAITEWNHKCPFHANSCKTRWTHSSSMLYVGKQ
jgi:hypothetical protein